MDLELELDCGDHESTNKIPSESSIYKLYYYSKSNSVLQKQTQLYSRFS